MVQLRGGYTTRDRRLDRLPEFDDRSRAFAVRDILAAEQLAAPRSYTWRVDTWLDQGQEGACVGFAWTHEASARPVVLSSLTAADARGIYRRAQQLDEWAGESYSGTSVLAGVKAAQERGWYGEYRWAFGLDDLILSVGYKGPAVLGIDWLSGMWQPDADGFLHASGSLEGGHAILCHSVSVRNRHFWLWNSWGQGWGVGGRAKISFDDMGTLLDRGGEACVPVKRYLT